MPAFPIRSAVQSACVRPPPAVAPPFAGSPGFNGRCHQHWESLACCNYLSTSIHSCLEACLYHLYRKGHATKPRLPRNRLPILLCSPVSPLPTSSCLPALQSLTPGAPAANLTCSSLLGAICLGIPVLDHRLLSTQLSTRPRRSPSGC